MINLLPPSEKRKLLKEYRMRLVVILLFAVMLIEAFTVALFAPSYLLIGKKTAALEAQLAQKKTDVPKGSADAQKELNQIKSEIALLKPSPDQPDILPSDALNAILLVKPAGIAVSSFAFATTQKNASIKLTGKANSREDLLQFQHALEANRRFSDVAYGENFITKKTDIDFTLTLSMK